MLEIEGIYQGNNKLSRKPKSLAGEKYTTLIQKIQNQVKSGEGLVRYTDAPIEYKNIDNLHELMKMLYYIVAQERAENNDFHNEKLGIIQFFAGELVEGHM